MWIVDGDIVLRAIEEEDNAVLKELINDSETESKVGGWSFPVSELKQKQWFENISLENSVTQFRFAVVLNGSCVGMIGLHKIDYKNSTAGVDIKLLSSIRGQGVGTRAMELLVKYAFDELNLHCLIANILENNLGSRRMFEKIGFKVDGLLRNRIYKGGRYLGQYSCSITKEDFEEHNKSNERIQRNRQ